MKKHKPARVLNAASPTNPNNLKATTNLNVASSSPSKVGGQSVIAPELENKYIFNGDGSILLKDGSHIGCTKSEGVICVLNVAKSTSTSPRQLETSPDAMKAQQEASIASHGKDFIISNPSQTSIYGVSDAGIFDLSKAGSHKFSEEDLEIHEDWEQVSPTQDGMKKEKDGHTPNFNSLQDSNELLKKKMKVAGQDNLLRQDLKAAQAHIQYLVKTMEHLQSVKSNQGFTSRARMGRTHFRTNTRRSG